ncbi:FAD-binding oxidoreductase [Legionella spiritensis]|uniref:FAD-binding oxidoreductase n=1 Tax=Legionella spiritensis TaxID=452 RepID=UPI000F6CA4EE|nr:FAD-binding oxidoreductase [Legionella spiritensis]VEG90673.1 oxidoreductase [Legionella spiritensis]
MLSKHQRLSNFSRAIRTTAQCFRPDNEWQIADLFQESPNRTVLARGQGSSYSDCCVNNEGFVIDCSRLNHLLSFDKSTGLLYCQAGVTFADLFAVHPDYIPPVIPGTLHATIAGGIANDVHGKNNVHEGSLGRHINWLELQIGNQLLRLSPERHADLFAATIAGLGLTGIIRRVGLTLRKASQFVEVKTEKHVSFAELLDRMKKEGMKHDYQVAWLDLLNTPQALLSLANHCSSCIPRRPYTFTMPRLPCRVITRWGMKQFNRYYFKRANTEPEAMPLSHFNNPLDSIRHWNRLYGTRGLLQFQAVFDTNDAAEQLDRLIQIIHNAKATPTLAVLKYFSQPGVGLLSFVQPGFAIAIDFINNHEAQKAIHDMNQFITETGGRVYLAKDLLLTRQQFSQQYDKHEQFSSVLRQYQCHTQSDMGQRLGLTPS